MNDDQKLWLAAVAKLYTEPKPVKRVKSVKPKVDNKPLSATLAECIVNKK